MCQIPIPSRFEHDKFSIKSPPELQKSVQAAVRSLLPNAQFESNGRLLQVAVKGENTEPLDCTVTLMNGPSWTYIDREIVEPEYTAEDRRRRVKERIRLGVLSVIGKEYGLPPSPWGILTGVRPTKLIHNMLDRGFSIERLRSIMRDVYNLAPERTELVLDIASKQRSFFHPSPNKPLSIYIGIPFCPTRCSYCSFAAYPVSSHGHLMPRFYESLCGEIEAVGRLLHRLDVSVESVYFGGGTPTTFQGKELANLLRLTREWFVSEATLEFTVEAGRPETLSKETLQILADHGVDRVSINPQTMNDRTLQDVGRSHTAQDTVTAFELARQVGIPLINMDIILGLPGEGIEDVERTLQVIGQLSPDNLTVHSLAMKRAARLRKAVEHLDIAQDEGVQMAKLARQYAQDWDLQPYYLYRQRYILSDLENIGYARPGTESIYNIQMMEERQSVLGLGGGGMTKLVDPDLRLERLANPKCPATYSQQLKVGLPAKLWKLEQHLAV